MLEVWIYTYFWHKIIISCLKLHPKVTTVGPKSTTLETDFCIFQIDYHRLPTWGISHVKSIHIRYKMVHIVGSHNLAHLVFHYINKQFLVILGPTLVTLGTILGMK